MKFAFASDLLFVFFATALPSLCFLRYLRVPLILSAFSSVLCGFTVLVPVWFFQNKKRKKKLQNAKELLEKDDLMLHFALLPFEETLQFFYRFYLTEFSDTKIGKDSQNHGFVETENELIFPLFTVAPLSGETALYALRINTEKEKTVLCSKVSDDARKLLSRFSVNVKTGDEIYLILKSHDALPNDFILAAPKKSFKENFLKKARLAFSKARAKPLFWGGALLLLTSLISPFPYYYLVFGGILVSCSLFVRFFGLR